MARFQRLPLARFHGTPFQTCQQVAERGKRFEAKLKRQAQQLGYKLVPLKEKPAA
jgi:hypothetical protein